MNIETLKNIAAITGGVVGVLGAISAYLSAENARIENYNAQKDALVLQMIENDGLAEALALRAGMLVDRVGPILEKGSAIDRDLLRGLKKMEKMPQTLARQYTTDQIDNLVYSQENARGINKILRGEKAIAAQFRSKAWDDIPNLAARQLAPPQK